MPAYTESFGTLTLVDPKTRHVTSFVHTIAAAASSSGVFRAEEFLRAVGAP
jgi:hypothetical protein